MNKRRTFIKQAGALTIGTLIVPNTWAAVQAKNVGLQLYSIKEEMDKDALGTLKKLAAIGYKEIESFAGGKGMYWGMTGKEFGTQIKNLGMSLSSTHFGGSEKLSDADWWKKTVDEAAGAGVKYLVASYLSTENTVDGYKKVSGILNKAGELSKKSGIQIAYHNHEHGFAKVDGEILYDVLLKETDPSLVAMELDIYWIVKAGGDPAVYFNKYPGRFPLWHVKDMDKVDRNINSDLGKGSIDYIALFKLAKRAGLKYPFIEQENFTGDYYDSLKVDYDFVKKIDY
jgi:sugar phosphate isomerase/epimerase